MSRETFITHCINDYPLAFQTWQTWSRVVVHIWLSDCYTSNYMCCRDLWKLSQLYITCYLDWDKTIYLSKSLYGERYNEKVMVGCVFPRSARVIDHLLQTPLRQWHFPYGDYYEIIKLHINTESAYSLLRHQILWFPCILRDRDPFYWQISS